MNYSTTPVELPVLDRGGGVYHVEAHGVSTTQTHAQNAAALLALCNSVSEGSRILFPPGKAFNLGPVGPIERALDIDFNGCTISADPTTSGANGSPLIWFRGTAGTSYALTPSVQGSDRVTLATPADAAALTVGGWVRIADSRVVHAWDDPDKDGVGSSGRNSSGYSGRSELRTVVSADATTGVVVVDAPIEWDYDTTPRLTLIPNMLQQPTVRGARWVEEIDPGTNYAGPLVGAVPHLFHFQLCMEPVVDACSFRRWQLHAVSFAECVEPRAFRLFGRDPFRAANGGHGYLVKFDHCQGGDVTDSVGVRLRHLVDWTQSYDGRSSGNLAVDCPNIPFLLHGLGEKRILSDRDVVYGRDGWAMGNPTFSASYGFTIRSPRYRGTGGAILTQTLSEGLEVIDPDIKTSFRGIVVHTGAKNTRIRGGSIEVSNSTDSGATAVLVRARIAAGDPFGILPDGLSIQGTRIVGSTAEARTLLTLELTGDLDIQAEFIGGGNQIFIGSGSTISRLHLVRNRHHGAYQRAALVQTTPDKLVISGNDLAGYTSYGYGVALNANCHITDNWGADTSWLFATSGDSRTAVIAGARIFRNTPHLNDYLPHNVQITRFRAESAAVLGPAGTNRELVFQTGQTGRWLLRTDSTAETGSNAGSNLALLSRTDAGGLLHTIMYVHRATGQTDFLGGPFKLSAAWNRPLILNGAYWWAGADGNLYRNTALPTNDADGTPVPLRAAAPAVLAPADGVIAALPIGAAYSQAEVQALRDQVEVLRDAVASLYGRLQAAKVVL